MSAILLASANFRQIITYLPLLSYCCEVLVFSKQQISQLNVCWNSAYRKAFKCNLWESVKELQLFCERMDLKHIFAFRKLSFCWKTVSYTHLTLPTNREV